MSFRRIPGWLPGILLLLPPPALGGPGLAVDLFEEGRWVECSRECRRVLVSDPAGETARLLQAVSSLRSGPTDSVSVDTLAALTRGNSPDVRAMAAYELGRVRWAQSDPQAAFGLLRQAFLEAHSHDLFLRAGCCLRGLLDDFPNIGKHEPLIFQSLETCRVLWTPEIRAECASPLRSRRYEPLAARPVRWVVNFYRRQIGPAIGLRCSLEPSCSAYFLEAGRRRGWLALPLMADRLVREPSVVAEGRKPVERKGQVRFADPVSDHDGWLHAAGGQ